MIRRKPKPRHPRPPSEAQVARARAEADLERTKAETPLYADLGRRLRELRQRNHFAESFNATFRGGIT